MRPSQFFLTLAICLAPVALIGTTWLYLYPIFHGCAFPTPPAEVGIGNVAPFRLLALGDPQLEGDSSLPDPNAPVFPSLQYVLQDLRYAPDIRARVSILRTAAQGSMKDALRWLEGKRKAVDLWGNDYYLAHIVTSTRWWAEPSHVAVLGDLLGSQWITDGEFEKRAGRYWGRVMKGLEKVPGTVYGVQEEEMVTHDVELKEENKDDEQAATPAGGNLARAIAEAIEEAEGRDEDSGEQAEHGEAEGKDEEAPEKPPLRKPTWGGTTEVLGADLEWANRVINIAGNHDVGYAGDLDESRVARFEKAFGSVNWDIWFTMPPASTTTETSDDSISDLETNDTPPALRIVVLNSMNIDTPAWSYELQTETYSFINHIITTARPVEDKTHATILLTHIPLEKQPGICVDSPYFDFFDTGQGLKEQNMLSDHSSETILQGVFGMSENRWAAGSGLGRRGIVLNGHDHEGCDVVHFIHQDGAEDCDMEHIKSAEAHWPATTSTSATEPPTGILDSLITSGTSSVNETNPLIDSADHATSPLTKPASDPEPEPEPEPKKEPRWRAHPYPNLPYSITHSRLTNTTTCTHIPSSPHIRELTLRSMMGDFSGHAGFLSAWFDPAKGETGEWMFDFASCGLGVQHWWWGVHSVDFAVVVLGVLGWALRVIERRTEREGRERDHNVVDGIRDMSNGNGNGHGKMG
ncbi:hypothetical protein EK21DRAFT_59931 [Setomelanomma holmii]|uniref:Calcineurin-like phosphoesterase domain-containing protein n=1 Tax=Setomelanomma holmii TaxID=210430 RepID=A0A9P4HGT9_9PLEO|nr:hypothetical protein EK21DRAFT_59931 [Setomelanomma holmii]